MKLRTLWTWMTALALVALFVPGCGDDATGGEDPGGDPDCTVGSSQACTCADGAAGTQTCPAGSWSACDCVSVSCQEGELCANLTAIEPDRVNFTIFGIGGTRTVKVRYANARGGPIPNATITWLLEETGAPMPGARLDAGSTLTDAQGIAENVVWAGNSTGSLRVTVSATAAAPLVYEISVASKDQGTLETTVEYPSGSFTGANGFDEVKVYAFEHSNGTPVACADLDPNNLTVTSAFSMAVEMPLPRVASRSFLRQGTAYTVLAVGKKSMPESAPVAVASACDEGPLTITGEQTTSVTLTLRDLIFPYAGTYEAHVFVNFIAMLPDGYEQYVQGVADFFTNPGDFVLGLLEDLIEEQFGFNVPDTFRPALAGVVNRTVQELLPDWVGNVFTVGGDLSNLLQNMEILNEYVISAEPTPSASEAGLLVFPTCAEGGACAQLERWKGFYFDWRLGRCEGLDPETDEFCGRNYLSIDSLVVPGSREQMSAVEGNFNASVRNLSELSIETHSLQLNWGAIVIGVVEKILLPAMVGVRSLDEFVFWMLGSTHPRTNEVCTEMAGTPAANCCDSLAWKVFDDPDSDTWRDVTKSICEAGVPILVETLTSYLLAQTADSGAMFQVGTSDQFSDIPAEEQKPCHLGFEAAAGGMRLKTWGGKPDAQRCLLRAGLRIGGLEPDYVEASFYAERVGD